MGRWKALRYLLLLAAALPAAAQPVPPAPVRWVTDRAGCLSDATRLALDRKLQDYQRRTGHQVLVWIDRSTGGEPIQEFGVRAFHAWGVGRKGVSDGLVIFLFTDDRKLRIEVGYGLEDKVPDAIASRIIHDQMAPRLGTGDHDGAIAAGVDAVLAALGGAPPSAAPGAVPSTARPAPPGGSYQQHRIPFWNLGCIPLVLLLGFFAWILKLVLGSAGDSSVAGPGDLDSSSSDSGSSSSGDSGGGGDFSGGGGDAGGGGADGSW
jgi:uncharacterized protein